VVIDAPAADRSDTAITLAPFVDATVLVVAAGGGSAGDPMILRDEIEAVGGKIAGVVVNRSTYNPPAFLRRLTG
jgi:Mrp family chromosome partitioning ATPase